MTRMRFKEKPVNDGMIIEVPYNALCLGIHTDPRKEMMSVVAWLEEVPIEEEYERKMREEDEQV